MTPGPRPPRRRPKEMIERTDRPGRNDPCHCGSGKKYKRCCMAKDQDLAFDPRQRVIVVAPQILPLFAPLKAQARIGVRTP
jgi:SEC-C motif